MTRQFAPLVIAAATLSACAPVPDARTGAEPTALAGLDTGRQCFFERSVSGFSEAPDGPERQDQIFVNTGPGEKFVLETLGVCPDVDYALQIGIDNRAGSSLCTGDTAYLVVPSTTGPDRCLVRVVGKIDD